MGDDLYTDHNHIVRVFRRWKLQPLKKGHEVSSIAAPVHFMRASNSPAKSSISLTETNWFPFSFPFVSSFQPMHAKMETSTQNRRHQDRRQPVAAHRL